MPIAAESEPPYFTTAASMSRFPVDEGARAPSSSDSDRPRVQRVVSDEELQRTFEGVASARPLQGCMVVNSLGAGRVVVVTGDGPQLVRREAGRHDSTSETFVLIVNVASIAELSYRSRDTQLPPDALAVMDGAHGCCLSFAASYEQIVIQFPRALIGRRHPDLLRSSGLQPVADDPATQLLVQMASVAAAPIPAVSHAARGHLSDAMLSMLGALSCVVPGRRSTAQRHLEHALADIEARLSDPDLCPDAIAGLRGISRRRLDSIFAEHGLSFERVLWDRRLDRAAGELAQATGNERKLLDVALSWGFSSEAHFSRRFKARFGCSPSEYRRGPSGRGS
jgi:AraC-like DNA-binding protein